MAIFLSKEDLEGLPPELLIELRLPARLQEKSWPSLAEQIERRGKSIACILSTKINEARRALKT